MLILSGVVKLVIFVLYASGLALLLYWCFLSDFRFRSFFISNVACIIVCCVVSYKLINEYEWMNDHSWNGVGCIISCCCIGLFVCFVIACHCKITAYVGDNKLILILLSYLTLWFQLWSEPADSTYRLVTGDRRYFHVDCYLRSQSSAGAKSTVYADVPPGSDVSFVKAGPALADRRKGHNGSPEKLNAFCMITTWGVGEFVRKSVLLQNKKKLVGRLGMGMVACS